MNDIVDLTEIYSVINLKGLDKFKLLKRYDTKFTFSIKIIPKLLNILSKYYNILEIDKKRVFNYETLYFDTDDYTFYNQHHNKNLGRVKIRFRKYKNSGLCYFEIKSKNNKGRTSKIRHKEKDIQPYLSSDLKNYVDRYIPQNIKISSNSLSPVLWTIFKRMTLVGKYSKERLTIDFDLSFKENNQLLPQKILKNIVVVELKQEKFSMESPFFEAVRKFHIKPTSFSKYCIGTALLNDKVKKNRFKSRLLTIDKIDNGGLYV